jgi:ketosteroid isomerase-like protein
VSVYHAIVSRRLRESYRRVGVGDYAAVLSICVPDVHVRIPGDGPLSGTFESVEEYERWFERVFTLAASLEFEIVELMVKGPPWNTRIAVEWIDTVTARDGATYVNEGAHFIHMRWGRLTSVHYRWNTELVTASLEHAAAEGIAVADA